MKEFCLAKKFLFFLPAVVLALWPLATSVLASGEESINGSITPLEPIVSITIDDNNLPYGIVPLGASDVAPNPDKVINITNNGNSTARLNIRGTDAKPIVAGQAEWQLVTSNPDTNTYSHKFQVVGSSGAEPVMTDLTFIPREPTSTQFAINVAPDNAGTVSLSFRISTPRSTNGFGQRNFGVIIQAVAQ